MRRALFVLITLMSFTTIASAQRPVPAVLIEPVPMMALNGTGKPIASARLDDVVARMMSFDRNHDRKVATDELPERMQDLVNRGDADLDGALDDLEIQTLAVRPTNANTANTANTVRGGFPHPGGYTFGDEAGLSTRSHVEGALEDLRLASSTKEEALGVVKGFVETLEEEASADLLKDMGRLLTPAQFNDFKMTLNNKDRVARMFFAINQAKDSPPRVVTMGPNLDLRIEQFGLAPEQKREALAALERFKTRLRPGDAERAVLLGQMAGILTDEERDNFRAALERRPLVKSGPFAGVVGGVVGGRTIERRVIDGMVIDVQPPPPPVPVR